MNVDDTQEYLLRKLVREFTEKEIAPFDASMDRTGEFDFGIIEKIGKRGFPGCGFDEKYGGAGLGKAGELFMVEEIATGSVSVALTIDATFLGMNCIDMFGSPEQKERYLPPLISGASLAAFALTEPSCGSDAAALQTKATAHAGGYVINGQKAWITNFGVADTYIVFAKTDPAKGAGGISAFIVERGAEGLIVGEEEDKMGVRGSNTGSLHFENLWVPSENILMKEGMGFKIAMTILDAARLHISAIGIGLMRHVANEALAYANLRRAFGHSIGQFQAIQFMLADMEIRLYAAKCMMRDAVARKINGEDYTEQAAMLKAFTSDAAMKTTNDAIQIFGGNGYSRAYPVERLMRDAKLLDIGEGTTQVLHMVIGKNLLKRGKV
jgi:alkylation response protein AidB-like acyl-CoA dehydrogenase